MDDHAIANIERHMAHARVVTHNVTRLKLIQTHGLTPSDLRLARARDRFACLSVRPLHKPRTCLLYTSDAADE